jgi:L-asparaginase
MVNSLQLARRRVVVLGTGGTIAGRAASAGDNIGYTAAQVGVAELLGGVVPPEGLALEAEQVAQLDSKDMAFGIWQVLARRCAHWLAEPDVAGLVITHGTDTIEETAFFLHSVLGPSKPVVLTCAMRPSTALSPDGPQNLRDALAVAASRDMHGVSVVCAGTVHGALDVQKVHTYRLDAFSSGDAGPLGYVEEGVFRRAGHGSATPASIDAFKAAGVTATFIAAMPLPWPRVEIVTSHAGASGAIVDALLRERAGGGFEYPLQGLVLAASGNGSVHHALEAAALRAQEAGVAVLRATRCAEGHILPRSNDRLRHAGPLTPVKARIALMLELLAGAGARAGAVSS